MKTRSIYICDFCGTEFSNKWDADAHEKSHNLTFTQYIDNKPVLGKATLEAVTKEYREEVPYEVLISYNGKYAWYRFAKLSKYPN
jgi:hypothetical protein